ncbi:Ltp family lipoprotein [Gordonia paraffinivorans]|uniref:Ltp family lipoprotein n=1 Tax=Gordonia paraffinivorans TaxID=175628 RepID=UPI001FFA3289|nr:Ltp family lipoprotein [Gordonia paraffinivorans]
MTEPQNPQPGQPFPGQVPQPGQAPYPGQPYGQQPQYGAPGPYGAPPAQPPAAPPKKKKKWPWILGILVVLIVIIAVTTSGGGDDSADEAASTQTSQPAPRPAEAEAEGPTETKAPEPAQTPTETKSEAAEPSLNSEQKNALRKAQDYLSVSGFSKSGLIKQLVFEGYSEADATVAVNKLETDGDVNWNEQAVKKAGEYQSVSPFSRQGLIEQLEFEGFTPEQAAYGADHAESD